jgi:hypothetical protein
MRPVRQLKPWKVVWAGGQLTLAALVPALRPFGAEVPRAAAGRIDQVAWITFAVLIVTGIWNVAAVSSEISHSASYRDTLIVKLVVVGISGLTALHARALSAVGLAVFGVLTGVSALAACSSASCWPAEPDTAAAALGAVVARPRVSEEARASRSCRSGCRAG